MDAEKYWKICIEENTFFEDGLRRTKLQWAVEQLYERFPKESFALVKRAEPKSRHGWVHLVLPAFYVDTYTEGRYEPDTWYSITGNYQHIIAERNALCQANKKRWLNE